MSIELKVPVFPESVADGTILQWNKKPGDVVMRDESLAEIETDKVVFELPAAKDGVLEEIIEGAGVVVTSGQLIGRMREATVEEAVAEETVAVAASQPQVALAGGAETQEEAPFATPSAMKLIAGNELDIHAIQGSGSGKRILKEDVLALLEQGSAAKTAMSTVQKTPLTVETKSQQSTARQSIAGSGSVAAEGERPQQRVPMTRLRARIAERLLEAQQNAAILTTFNEVNMQPVMDLRTRYREAFEKRYGVRLGFMSFFVKASIEGLKRFPALNASIDGTDIIYHGFFDIGIAVSSPRGLVVPILRDADRMAMADIDIQIGDYAGKAREGSLSLEDITGGTFTITNGGVFGSLLSTPILNPPQSGILGMHKIQERPIAENGEVVIQPMMNIALSYDHRLVDGREAVQFLVTVKEILEDPARLMLGV